MIEVKHGASPGLIGAATFGIGLERSRRRQGQIAAKYAQAALDRWERDERQFAGFKYRAALEGQHQRIAQKRFDVRQKYYQERDTAREARRAREARGANLTQIPDWVDLEMRRDLRGKATAIKDMLLSGKFDLDRPEIQDKANDLIDSYENTIANLRPPSVAETEKRDRVWLDKEGQPFDKPGPGRTAYRKSTGKPVIDTSAEQTAAKDAERAKQTKLKALKTQMRKWKDQLQKVLHEGEEPLGADAHWPETLQGNIDKLQKQIDALEAPEEITEQAPQQLSPEQEARRRVGLGNQGGVPTGRQGGSAIQQAIAAAQDGDVEAQRALSERGIPWR